MHPILKRLSYSGIGTLHLCPRKYWLTKLLGRAVEETDDLNFGKAVGAGVQMLLTGSSKEEIYLYILSHWVMDIEDIDQKTLNKKKTIWHAFHAIEVFTVTWLPIFQKEYEVANFQGKSASELGFRIYIGDDYEYRGFVDIVLINKKTRQIIVLEIKTTAYANVYPESYQNSEQGLIYSILGDYIVAQPEYADINSSAYQVFYLVYKTKSYEYEKFVFTKTAAMRAAWVKQMLIEVSQMEMYDKDEHWPIHGESCRAFGRTCQFFGTCTLSDNSLLAGVAELVLPNEGDKFQFNLQLIDIINTQLQKQLETTNV